MPGLSEHFYKNPIAGYCQTGILFKSNIGNDSRLNIAQVKMSCEACRTIPPVTTGQYVPKGQYETIAGLKTCKYTKQKSYVYQ